MKVALGEHMLTEQQYYTSALWGFVGAGINASLRLFTALNEGTPPAIGPGRRAAMAQFVVAIFVGIGMAAAFTPLLTAELHAPCPPVAVTIGLGGNAIAVTLRDNVAERIAAIIEAVFGSNKPRKVDQ